jgi:hypothetical protein
MMTTFTTEDREQFEKEPIPFYGYCYLTDLARQDQKGQDLNIVKKVRMEYRIDDSSEDLES